MAAIRRPKRQGITEYLFNERQQLFTLKETAKLAEQTKLLKQALAKNLPVRVRLDSRRALIQRVDAPAPQEAEEFRACPLFS